MMCTCVTSLVPRPFSYAHAREGKGMAGQYFCTATLSSSSVSTALTSTVTLHVTYTVHPGLDIVGNKVIIIIGLVSWIQSCHLFSFGHYASSAWCIMRYTVYPGLVSCPFYAIPIYPFKFMKFFIYLFSYRKGPKIIPPKTVHKHHTLQKCTMYIHW